MPTPARSLKAAAIGSDERSRGLLINGALVVLLALITVAIPLTWMSGERFFFYWDLSNYHNMVSSKAIAFQKAPLAAIHSVIRSIGNDYNEIFTLPLVPFMLVFGDSRQVYVVSVALVYLLPLAMTLGAIARELIPLEGHAVFWSTALLTLLIPMAWGPVLMGWPDAGGALFVGLAVWVYVQDISLRRWWQMPLIGVFVGAAMLFRRHFAYAGVAFFVSITVQALMVCSVQLRRSQREALQSLVQGLVRIGLAGAACLMTLAILGWAFLHNVLTRDYGVHDSYVRSIAENLRFYTTQYGWLSCVFATLGLAAGSYSRALARPVATFLLLFAGVSLAQWVFAVRFLGTQYTVHFTLFVVLGLTTLGWIMWITFAGKPRALMMSAATVYVLLNGIVGLTSTKILKNSPLVPMFSSNYAPLVRPDYERIVQLISYLRSMASRRQPIYVAASSYDFNWDLLGNAERTLYGSDLAVLNILPTPEIDSRDGYPLPTLLRAQYVIWATPFQHHLPSDEQDVAKVGFLVFKEHWQIAQDFVRLPEQFDLENGVVVKVYKRIRPTSLDVALRTLEAMRTVIGSRVNQSDWVGLSQYSRSSVVKQKDNSYYAVIEPGYHDREPTPAFVYIGALPAYSTVTGTWAHSDERCLRRSLGISSIDRQNKIIGSAEIVNLPTDPPEFSVHLPTEDTAYLVLKVSGTLDNHSADCSVRIDNLRVSAG